MNTDDSNVEDMNIHHITECFSLTSVTFIEDRFGLVRTRSFTLFKNDLDPNDKSDSVSSSPMWLMLEQTQKMIPFVTCEISLG